MRIRKNLLELAIFTRGVITRWGRIRALRRRQPISFSRHDTSFQTDRDKGGPRLSARHGDALARRSRQNVAAPPKAR
jgi:hypothetical protein